MLCLSIRQPYIGDIVSGEKTVEMRSWPTNHRGPLALHCSKAGLPQDRSLTRGAVVAVCEVVDCRPLEEDPTLWGWHLRSVRRVKPHPCRGNARFFKVPDNLVPLAP